MPLVLYLYKPLKFSFSASSLFTASDFSLGSSFLSEVLPSSPGSALVSIPSAYWWGNHRGLLWSLKHFPFRGLWDVLFLRTPSMLYSYLDAISSEMFFFTYSILSRGLCSPLVTLTEICAFMHLCEYSISHSPQGTLRAHFQCHCNVPCSQHASTDFCIEQALAGQFRMNEL